MLEELEAEIPAFLHFLNTREMTTKNQSRMWFSVSQIKTEALQRVIRRSRNWLEVEMLEILIGLMDGFELEEICVCVNDMIPYLIKSGYRISRTSIIKVLREEWNIEPVGNTHKYTRYALGNDGSITPMQAKGRYYRVEKNKLLKFDA